VLTHAPDNCSDKHVSLPCPLIDVVITACSASIRDWTSIQNLIQTNDWLHP